MDNDVRGSVKEEALDTLSDEELVVAHLHGRNGAFEDLYDRYRDRLVHFVTRKTGDGDQGAGPGSGGVHPSYTAPPPVRHLEEIFDLGVHDCEQPLQE